MFKLLNSEDLIREKDYLPLSRCYDENQIMDNTDGIKFAHIG